MGVRVCACGGGVGWGVGERRRPSVEHAELPRPRLQFWWYGEAMGFNFVHFCDLDLETFLEPRLFFSGAACFIFFKTTARNYARV